MKKITDENRETLFALCLMWMQYCPPPFTHEYMSAGEHAEGALNEYGLLGTDDYPNFEKLGIEGIEYLYRNPTKQ